MKMNRLSVVLLALVASMPLQWINAQPALVETINLGTWSGTLSSPFTTPLPPAPSSEFSLTSVSYDPMLNALYVADSAKAYVYRIDTLTNTITWVMNVQGLTNLATILDVYEPLTVLANPASGRWAVVSPVFGPKFTGTHWDGPDSVPAGTILQGASWNPVTDTIYSANGNFYAMQNLKFLTNGFACSGSSNATTFNPVTGHVYVSCGSGSSNAGIYVFDGNDLLLNGNSKIPAQPITSAVPGIPTSQAALGLAMNPITNRIYATGLTNPTSLDVYDAGNLQLMDSIPGISNQRPFAPLPQPIAINTKTNTIFVLNSFDSTISIFDGNTNTLTGTINIPIGAIIDNPAPGTKVGNVVFDPVRKISTTLGGAVSMAVNETANRLYVASVNGAIDVFDLSGQISNTTPTPASNTTGVIPVPAPIPSPTPNTQFTVSVALNNPGTVTVTPPGVDRALNCGSACSAKFNTGTVITLTAKPPHDKSFEKWSGACSNTAPVCALSVNSDLSVTAIFSKHKGKASTIHKVRQHKRKHKKEQKAKH